MGIQMSLIRWCPATGVPDIIGARYGDPSNAHPAARRHAQMDPNTSIAAVHPVCGVCLNDLSQSRSPSTLSSRSSALIS